MGYPGSERTVRRFLTGLRKAGKAKRELTVRFETPPGRQAQADWVELGWVDFTDGTRHKIHAFEMVLGHSRLGFLDFALDVTLSSLLTCLRSAFEFLDGVPLEVLFDNMASVRLPGSKEIHPAMLDFSKHHGFAPKTHRPYRPRTNGKVERFGGYAQSDFIRGRSFENLADLQRQGRLWLDQQANVRVHGTTGEVPREVYETRERQVMQPLPPPYLGIPLRRKVSRAGLVHHAASGYSVPPELYGQSVWVSAQAGQLRVFTSKGLVVAQHPLANRPGQTVTSPAHVAEMWRLSVPALAKAKMATTSRMAMADGQSGTEKGRTGQHQVGHADLGHSDAHGSSLLASPWLAMTASVVQRPLAAYEEAIP